MRMNKKMEKIYYSHNKFNFEDDSLIKAIGEKFVQFNGTTLLKYFFEKRNPEIVNSDICWFERDINSFHPDDYVSDNIFEASFSFMKKVLSSWKKSIPDKRFIAMLSYGDEDPFPDDDPEYEFIITYYIAIYSDATGCPGNTSEDEDLEEYRYDAVLVMTSEDV